MARKSASTSAKQKQEARNAVRFAAQLMKNGISDQVIQLKLTEMGYTAVQASAIVNNLHQVRAQVQRKTGRRNMIIGAVVFIAGVVVLIAAGQSVQGTATYVIMWALALFGIAQFVGGLLQYRNK